MSSHEPMASARTQAAIVRALVDEVEHAIANSNAEHWMQAQLIEELARLGCRIIDVADAWTASCPAERVPVNKESCIAVGSPP